jgi:hypothetical protein
MKKKYRYVTNKLSKEWGGGGVRVEVFCKNAPEHCQRIIGFRKKSEILIRALFLMGFYG